MNTQNRTIILWSLVGLLFMAGVVTLFISMSGPKEEGTELEAIYTNAALTFSAQQLTLQADLLSATPNPALSSPTPTFTLYPSGTPPTASATSALPAVISTCDNSAYLSDVTIPDNTAVTAGQTFTKTWKVSNTGTCTWTATYQIIFVSGEGMSGKATPIGVVVAPGQSVDVSVAMTAPAKAGTLTGTWRLSNDKSQAFGTLLTVVVNVGNTASTVSVSPTGATNTSTPTATATATATATPPSPEP